MTPPKPLTQRERIARLIRTTRLQSTEQSRFRKSGINKVKILFSPFAPADDHDLELADRVIEDLMNARNSAK